MTTPPPPDAPFDAIQDAIHGAGKAGAVQALGLMEKVAEILGNQRIFDEHTGAHERQGSGQGHQGWVKACAAMKTIAKFMKEHALAAPVQSVETGQIDKDGQPIEMVLHLDAELVAEVVTEVVKALRAQS